MDIDFWAERRCLVAPIPEIFTAADLLQQAVKEHNNGNQHKAAALIQKADMPILAEWTNSLWGKPTFEIHRFRKIDQPLDMLSKEQRLGSRMPNSSVKNDLVARDGHHCRYCGIPVIRPEIRNKIKQIYPDVLRWGKKNNEQHSAFQCLWLTYEHVVSHSRGGDNSLENMIISCQACNCAKMEAMLEEMGLSDPRLFPPSQSSWIGLEEFKI